MESLGFRKWSLEFIRPVVRDYDLNGIIWDEPKVADFVTVHPAAKSAFPGECSTKGDLCSRTTSHNMCYVKSV